MTEPTTAVKKRWYCDCAAPIHRDTIAAIEREAAAAILAALPPDWCGHSGDVTARGIELARQQAAEIARLRKIEEAAIRISDKRTLDGDGYWVSKREMRYLDDALRAALEDER